MTHHERNGKNQSRTERCVNRTAKALISISPMLVLWCHTITLIAKTAHNKTVNSSLSTFSFTPASSLASRKKQRKKIRKGINRFDISGVFFGAEFRSGFVSGEGDEDADGGFFAAVVLLFGLGSRKYYGESLLKGKASVQLTSLY
jgi:hypothetical protein